MPRQTTKHGLEIFTEQEYHDLVKAKNAPSEAAIIKGCFAEIATVKGVKGAPASYTFTISTASADRDKDIVAVDGWDLANYKKNPVVLFGHDYHSLPVGKSVSLAQGKDALKASVEFVSKDIYPFADTVRQMVEGGFLRAASVGFKPSKALYNEKRGGVDIQEAELLEWSIVPVPANQDCLVQLSALPTGVTLDYLKHCEEVLAMAKGKGQWMVGLDLAGLSCKAVSAAVVEALAPLITIGKDTTEDDAMEHEPEIGMPGCKREGGCKNNATGTVENCPMNDCPGKDVTGPLHQDGADLLVGIEYKEPVLELAIDDEESLIDVGMDEFDAAIKDVTARCVSEMVIEQVTKQINYARGRVD